MIQNEEVKTITDHTDDVNSLLPQKKKRVASCSNDNTKRIDYHCEQVI